MIKISIIIPILNSHKAVARQLLYLRSLKLPDSIEIIFIDDGSDPPLKQKFANFEGLKNFYIYPTGDTRPWTQPCARNMGARLALGEFLLMTDIDHILTKKIIRAVLKFCGDKMVFSRRYAIINEEGKFSQKLNDLCEYGFIKRRYRRRKFRVYSHTNSFAMRRKIFWEIGGYDENRCDKNTHPTHDDLYLHSAYRRHYRKRKCKPPVKGPVIYTFPASGLDPKNLFHKLKR